MVQYGRSAITRPGLARRQQRITVELLADRAGMSVPTLRRLLNTGAGSLENYLRVARVLGLLDAAVAASDPLNTPMGRLRADEDTPQRVRR
ncbi:MAG: helix-turn-helix transcriptional regulator [Kiritimatiellae bacterium]|nr:helix-turn-helix transcriptional regulator [Kiritimatiellia bacterium]